MNIAELEKRLQEHAEIVKASMATPFVIEKLEREDLSMKKKKINLKTITLTAAAICVIGTTAFAAARLLSPKQIANELGDATLAEYFEKSGTVSETKEDGKYKATILGTASGRNISNFKASAWDLYPDRTYVAVAVEKADGSEMTYDDKILVTPLIGGLDPMEYNVVTMNGGYSAKIIDGVLYRIIECDSIEFFADKKLYIAVTDTIFLNKNQFVSDSNTESIVANESYDGTNIIFDFKLDAKKANPQKAKEYLDSLKVQNGN